jgi:hypothetical protein
LLSGALGERIFPDHQWRRLADTWQRLYPLAQAPAKVAPAMRQWLPEIPKVADALTSLRFPALGASLPDHLGASQHGPQNLRSIFGPKLQWARPSLAIGALGQARADGTLAPEAEARVLDRLLRRWALRRSGLTRFRMSFNEGEDHARLA